MSNTAKRVIVGVIMALVVALAALGEYFGIPAVRYLSVLIVVGMIAEMVICIARTPRDILKKNWISFGAFLLWLCVMLAAANYVGTRPWIMLLLLLIICCADIGAWFFGRMIGGDKMWERLSANKTWAGQIAGILCGTFASVMYGLLGADVFMPQLMWIGISIALLSQYGDLTASWIKRKMGLKDFGRILPGHGGLLDRFDGWIYALPLIWLVML
ncbi:MAG TPA: phosphatidate cytidylyltransferase [Candidatus Enterousia intestinigallinarum]|uniref:Phosphatidate cytidylyltransferase n=1 Tax=Candidatus Enterousia intestinigallinarum TaxID=2840790 RepID=A0A9D1FFL1_9PROT|nr:phosphatidate cytidylyltransferase [Candidatus Enterousia intestinigallinarum]